MHPTTDSKEPVFLLKRPHLPHGLGTRGAKLQEMTHLPGMIVPSPHQNVSAECWLQYSPHSHYSPPLPAVLVFRYQSWTHHFSASDMLVPSLGTAPRLRGGSMTVPASGWDFRKQPQGAKGTTLFSMAMQQPECISSLLPRVYYYYLYLSSI